MKSSYKSLKIFYDNNNFNIKFLPSFFRPLYKKEVLVKIKYSNLNYKDALSVTGTSRIIRGNCLVPGLDFSGTVIDSNSSKYTKGDDVLATGAGLGETIDGGFSEYAYVPENILIKLPNKLSLFSSMQIGTAGFTAAISIDKMIHNKQKISSGPIAITGASGGVGSIAINILSNLGFEIIAITKKNNVNSYLKKIGASKVFKLKNYSNDNFLNKTLFAGAVDNVGGEILNWIIKSTSNSGNIICVGMALNHKLNTSVFPFIIRGINLLGVSSTNYPNNKRKYIWKNLSNKYKPNKLNIINSKCINMEDIVKYSKKIISGKSIGKVIIKIS